MRMEVTTDPALWTRWLKVEKLGQAWSDVCLPGPSSPPHTQLLAPSICGLWPVPYPLLS